MAVCKSNRFGGWDRDHIGRVCHKGNKGIIMITIWKMIDEISWEFVEEITDESLLAQRLSDLRLDGNQYRAEKRDGGFSSILGV
jgi:hypothetical protein